MNVIYTDMVFSPSWDPSVEISAQLVPWHPQGPSTPHLPPRSATLSLPSLQHGKGNI